MLKLGVLVLTPEILSVQKSARIKFAVALLKRHEERKVSELSRVVNKKFRRLAPIILAQNDMTHCHTERGI